MTDPKEPLPEALRQLFVDYAGGEPDAFLALPHSGSSRRYFSLSKHGEPDVIGTVGEDVEENRAFIALARHFAAKHLPSPKVLAVSKDERCYLQTNEGGSSLFDYLQSLLNSPMEKERAHGLRLLKRVMRLLPEYQIHGAEGLDFSLCYPQPEFDRRNVEWDLSYFKYCFLKASELPFSEPALQDDFDRLAEELLGEPFGNRLMLRDFQSRNILVGFDDSLVVIDFQGARRGPMTYDVASFLWQARANYAPELKQELLATYLERVRELDPDFDLQAFLRQYPSMVLFRILQTLGAYGYRGWLQRKPHFIQSVPLAVAHLQELFDGHPELANGYPELCRLARTMAAKYPLAKASTAGVKDKEASDNETFRGLTVTVISFSYKAGLPIDPTGNGGGFIFDTRSLPNPGREVRYHHSTGLDDDVARFFDDHHEEMSQYTRQIYPLVHHAIDVYQQRGFTNMQIAFGCTGGQHRSVYLAHKMALWLKENICCLRIREIHREQHLSFTHTSKVM